MKNLLKMSFVMALLGSMTLLSSQTEAWPGYGGTVTSSCSVTRCVEVCFSGGGFFRGAGLELEGGAKYETVEGSERSCGDKNSYCSFDFSFQA